MSSFGGFIPGGAPYQGTATFLSQDLAVFAEPREPGLALVLVRITGEELHLVGETVTQMPFNTRIAGLIGDAVLETHLVPLSETRLALISSRYGVEVFDVEDDELVSKSSLWLDHSDSVEAAVGFEGHLFACGDDLEVYAISSQGEVSLGSRVDLGQLWPCNALALTPDRSSLYMGTTRDIRVLSLGDPKHPALTQVIGRPQHYYMGVAVSADKVAVQEDVFLEATGDASLLSSSSFAELRVFAQDSLDYNPYGVGFVAAGMVLQKQRHDGQRRELALELYDPNGVQVPKQAEAVFREYESPASIDIQPYPLVTRGNLALVSPTRQVLRVEADAITPLRGVEQGSLARAIPAGPGRVATYGATSTHLVDISNPEEPRILSGGVLEPGLAGSLAIGLSGSDHVPTWLTIETPVDAAPQAPAQATISAFAQLGDEAPNAVGSVTIAGGPALRVAASGLLFELRGTEATTSLRTYALPSTPGSGQALTPLAEQLLSADGMFGPRIAVDVPSGALVMIGKWTQEPSKVLVRWFERANGRWAPAAEMALPTELTVPNFGDYVAVKGGTVVAVSENGRRLHVLRRTESGIEVVSSRDLEAERMQEPFEDRSISGILGFDGGRVYARGGYRDEIGRQPRVFAFDLRTLARVAEYELTEDVSSMTVSDGNLVFAMPGQLTLATPACGQ